MSRFQQFGSSVKNFGARTYNNVSGGIKSFGQGITTGYNYIRNPITRAGVAPIRQSMPMGVNNAGFNTAAYRAGVNIGKFSARSFNSLSHFVKVTMPANAIKLGRYTIQVGNKVYQAVKSKGQFMWRMISTNAKRFLQALGKSGTYIGRGVGKVVHNFNTGVAEALVPEVQPVTPKSSKPRHVRKAAAKNQKMQAQRAAKVTRVANGLRRAEITGATLGAGSLVYGLLTRNGNKPRTDEE